LANRVFGGKSAFCVNIISLGNDFKSNLKRLLNSDYRLLSLKDIA